MHKTLEKLIELAKIKVTNNEPYEEYFNTIEHFYKYQHVSIEKLLSYIEHGMEDLPEVKIFQGHLTELRRCRKRELEKIKSEKSSDP